MIGYRFQKQEEDSNLDPFEKLLRIFKEILVYTSGDVADAIDWMNEIDREHHITDNAYGMGDFIQDLRNKGYIKDNVQNGSFEMSSKMEQSIRKSALEEIFGQIKKSGIISMKIWNTQKKLHTIQFLTELCGLMCLQHF